MSSEAFPDVYIVFFYQCYKYKPKRVNIYIPIKAVIQAK